MDEEDGRMLTDTVINYEETMEASASAEFGGNCARKKHKHWSWLAHSGSDDALSGLEAKNIQAIRGDAPTMIARDLLDPRGHPSKVNQLYKGKLSDRWTMGEQQLDWNWSSDLRVQGKPAAGGNPMLSP
jgi:hypothetical protein